jgi:hypothetical protein
MPFDYSTLEHDAKAVVLAATERIDQQNGTQAEAIIAIGKELIEVKQALKHGQFGDWLRNEFGWSPRTLSCICGSQRSLGRKAQSFRHLQPTTLHALCARSLPEVVREG